MEEFRVELFDDEINFMGLAEPKEIIYLNFAEADMDLPFEQPEFPMKVGVYLSQKVTK